MPSRWWVPIPGIKPEFVRLEHIHGALSQWFDKAPREHHAKDKPYTISPLSADPDESTGVEVAVLNPEAEDRLREATEGGTTVRIGNQIRPVGRPRLIAAQSWEQLAACTGDSRWELTLLTPATFRTGNRTSPLPNLAGLLRSLDHHWRTWSPVTITGPPLPDAERHAWVSDIDLTSEILRLTVPPGRTGGRTNQTVSAAIGSLTIRCDDPEAAATIGPLLCLAPYTGVGALTRKGLGVTRVRRVAHRRQETRR